MRRMGIGKEEMSDHGFRAIKMKVGLPHLREDIERVAAVRELLGPDIPLMVDANMRWNVDQAIWQVVKEVEVHETTVMEIALQRTRVSIAVDD